MSDGALPIALQAQGLAAGAGAQLRAVENGFSRAKSLIATGKDLTIAVYSDSLGNDTFEAPYQFLLYMAGKYPERSVYYNLISQSAPNTSWSTQETVQAGTGSAKITMWNFAVAGTRPDYALGHRRQVAMEIIGPDVIIFQHGANNFVGNSSPIIRGEFWMFFQELSLIHPGVPIIAIREPPFRSDNSDAANHDAVMIPAWDEVMALLPQVTVADAWSRMVGRDTSASSPLYADNIHLSAAGQLVANIPALTELWDAALPTIGSKLPYLDLSARRFNLIDGGDLASWSAGLPVSSAGTFSAIGSATIAQVTSPSDRRSQYATITSTGVSGAGLRWTAGSTVRDLLKGKRITASARLKPTSGATNNSGRIQVQIGSTALGTQVYSSRASADPQGAWVYKTLSDIPVPDDATYIYFNVYADSGTSTGTVLGLDSMSLGPGALPRAT